MNGRALENPAAIEYEGLFSVRYLEIGERQGTWGFTVTENHTIFISPRPHPHSHISDVEKVETKDTLAEGYIHFDSNGKVRYVEIKPLYARGNLGQRPQEEQEKISEAIRNVIKKKLNK